MDGTLFDALSKSIGERIKRRSLVRLLSGAAVAVPVLAAHHATEARRVRSEHNRRQGGKKTIMCYEGKTVRVSTNQRKKWLRKGATRGKCDGCTPVCAPGTCGDDGCGGVCSCDAGSVCVEGTCEACDVTCSGTPAECGEVLSVRTLLGGVVRVCPGEYRYFYFVGPNLALYGAGNDDDPTTSTILSWNADFTYAPIIMIDALIPITVSFTNIRVAGGQNASGAGGIEVRSAGTMVTLQDCVLAKNTGTYGGGAYVFSGAMTIDGCEFIDNTATSGGGGLGSNSALNVTNTSVTGNSASFGGGLYTNGGVTTLAPSVTITANEATGGPGSGGGIRQAGGVVNVNGAAVTGNTPDQCSGVAC